MDFDTPRSNQQANKSARREDAAGEWFEDAESDADWVEGLSLMTTSSYLNDTTVNTEDLIERNFQLTEQLQESSTRLEQFQSENEKLKTQLSLENQKQLKFQKKLKYIQDNQAIFSRLKEAYLNMKYNESSGQNSKLISESSSQTWSGILCEGCIKTADEKNSPPNNRTAIADILDTINQIRNVVDKKERASALSEHKQEKHVEIINSLESQNRILQELLKSKYAGTCSPEKQPNYDGAFMKRIIFKQEKRLREMLRYSRCRKYTNTPLNDNEKAFVDIVVSQYLRKTGKKSSTNIRCRSCDREPKLESIASFSWGTKLEQAAEKLENVENPINLSETTDTM